jgi:hypothetical protein
LSFLPHLPIIEIVSTGIIFPFTYMCTQYLHHIHLSSPFFHFLPLPLVLTSSGRTCSSFLVSHFV